MVNKRARTWLLTGGALATAAITVTGVLVLWPDSAEDKPSSSTPSRSPISADEAAAGFLSAFANNDISSSAARTDNRGAAEPVLKALRNPAPESRPDKIVARLKTRPSPGPEETDLTVPFTMRWEFGKNRVWEYEHTLSLHKDGSRWSVKWTPQTLHPELTPGRTLSLSDSVNNGELLGGDGKPISGNDLSPAVLPAVRRATSAQLKGEPSWRLTLKEPDGREVSTLAEHKGKAADNAAVSLLPAVQGAAQRAVSGAKTPAMIVAMRTTGEILAVAQNQAADAKGLPALSGLYPPGSTFKIATAAAVLQAGAATPTTVLPCPGEQTINQRRVRNDESFTLGEVPLRTAFAHSCNTTFAQLASDLPTRSLPDAARQLGIGVDYDIPGITTNTGNVREPGSPAAQVETSFGQGQAQTSPFGMALAAATVAGGRRPIPGLLKGEQTTVKDPAPHPSSGVAAQLRGMMREVVTGGTAKALGGLGPVHGKTGTAQFGDGTRSHGWFVGFRNNVAFAVLIEDAGSSKPAVAMAAQFLKGFG